MYRDGEGDRRQSVCRLAGRARVNRARRRSSSPP